MILLLPPSPSATSTPPSLPPPHSVDSIASYVKIGSVTLFSTCYKCSVRGMRIFYFIAIDIMHAADSDKLGSARGRKRDSYACVLGLSFIVDLP
jgi:hypothetical protein